MKVKNYFVSDKEKIINIILKELSINSIPYVYIKESSEIHFDNYIIHIYDLSLINIDDVVDINIDLYNKDIFSVIDNNFDLNINYEDKSKLRPSYKNKTNKLLNKTSKTKAYNYKRHL